MNDYNDGFTEVVLEQCRSVVCAKSSSVQDSWVVEVVPRPLVVFVRRLHVDATEMELINMLSKVGMADARCRRLKMSEGRTFIRTAAFRVPCDPNSADSFLDECS